jgi:hypothetical protein
VYHSTPARGLPRRLSYRRGLVHSGSRVDGRFRQDRGGDDRGGLAAVLLRGAALCSPIFSQSRPVPTGFFSPNCRAELSADGPPREAAQRGTATRKDRYLSGDMFRPGGRSTCSLLDRAVGGCSFKRPRAGGSAKRSRNECIWGRTRDGRPPTRRAWPRDDSRLRASASTASAAAAQAVVRRGPAANNSAARRRSASSKSRDGSGRSVRFGADETAGTSRASAIGWLLATVVRRPRETPLLCAE